VASGYVLWVRDQNLLARPVDLDFIQGRTTGSLEEPSVVAASVESQLRLSAAFSVSDTGVLVYQAAVNANRTSLLRLNRRGERLSQLGAEADYSNLEISPEGTRLLVSINDPSKRTRDIWQLDLDRGVPTRLTFEPTDDRSAVWSMDGQSIVYRGRDGDLFTRPLGRGEEQPLLVDKRSKDPDGWSADGKHLLYRVVGNGNDLWIKPAGGDPYPFIATAFNEPYGQFSPDGRWVAYVSDEAGAMEVYVTAFPSGQGKVRVSSSGGYFPRWRKDGKEIYFLTPDGKMMMAGVRSDTGTFRVETAKALFQTTVAATAGSSYVVSDDGQWFLVNSRAQSTSPPALGVIFNWPALVRKPQ
jgi:Tol biopolymer transport system component